MKLLADENMDAKIIDWLRSIGTDVLSVREIMASAQDEEVLAKANAEGRVVLTKDLDFGEMLFHENMISTGIILLRLKSAPAYFRLEIMQKYWPEIAARVRGNFVVVMQDRLRVRALPKQ